VFPDKAKMIRSANALLAILIIAPFVYIITAAEVTIGGRGLANNQSIVSLLFPALVGVSVANIGIMILLQMRWRPMAGKAQYDPVTRVYLIFSMGAVLSEANSIYGLILSFRSGSTFYVIGFSLASWLSLLWVRARFKRNLANI
jgi:hypothetical protein